MNKVYFNNERIKPYLIDKLDDTELILDEITDTLYNTYIPHRLKTNNFMNAMNTVKKNKLELLELKEKIIKANNNYINFEDNNIQKISLLPRDYKVVVHNKIVETN